MEFPVDFLAAVSQTELEHSAQNYMNDLLYGDPESPELLTLSDSTQVPINISSVGVVPLYGSNDRQKILALFSPGDPFTAVALYLLDRWWTVDDILNTADPARDGAVEVETIGDRIVLYILNRVIYRAKEMSSEELPFLCHGEKDKAKILWNNGEAVGFYSVKPSGSLFNSFSTRSYQLPVMDSIFVRKCHRNKGFGLRMLEDFVFGFKDDSLGLRFPLTKTMYKVCEKFLRQYPGDTDLLWEVEGIGMPKQRTNIASKIKAMELSAVSKSLSFKERTLVITETSQKDLVLEAMTTTQTKETKSMKCTVEIVEEFTVLRATNETDVPVTARGRSSGRKRTLGEKIREDKSEKIIRIEDIEAETPREEHISIQQKTEVHEVSDLVGVCCAAPEDEKEANGGDDLVDIAPEEESTTTIDKTSGLIIEASEVEGDAAQDLNISHESQITVENVASEIEETECPNEDSALRVVPEEVSKEAENLQNGIKVTMSKEVVTTNVVSPLTHSTAEDGESGNIVISAVHTVQSESLRRRSQRHQKPEDSETKQTPTQDGARVLRKRTVTNTPTPKRKCAQSGMEEAVVKADTSQTRFTNKQQHEKVADEVEISVIQQEVHDDKMKKPVVKKKDAPKRRSTRRHKEQEKEQTAEADLDAGDSSAGEEKADEKATDKQMESEETVGKTEEEISIVVKEVVISKAEDAAEVDTPLTEVNEEEETKGATETPPATETEKEANEAIDTTLETVTPDDVLDVAAVAVAEEPQEKDGGSENLPTLQEASVVLVEEDADAAASDSALPPSNEEEATPLTVEQQSEETSQTSELQSVTVDLVDLTESHLEAQEETAEEEAEGKTATEEGEEEQREDTTADDIPASTTGIENTGNLEEEEEKCEEESEEAVTAKEDKAKSTDEDEEETVAETRTLRVRKQAVKATPRRKSSRLRKGEEEKEETPEVEEEEPAAKVRVLRRGRKSIPVTPRSTNKRTRKQIQEKEGGEESTAEEKEEPVVEQLQVIVQESVENLEEEDETQQVESEKDLTGAEEAVVQQDAPEEGQANEGKTPEDVALETDPTQETQVEEDQSISTSEVVETTVGECTQETRSIVKDGEVKDVPEEEKEPPIIESSGEAKVEEEKEGEAGLGTAKAQEEDKKETVTLEVENAGSEDETVNEVEKMTGMTAAAGDLVKEGEADVALLQPTSDSALPPSNEEEVIHLTVAQQSEETSQTSELQRVTVVLVDLKKSHHETQEETAEEEAEGKTATEEGEEEQREDTTADDIPASTTGIENTGNLEEEKCEEESEEAVTAKEGKAKSTDEDEEETVAETRTLRVRKQAVKATPRRKSSRLRKGEEEKEETPEVEEEEPAPKVRVLRRGRKSIPVTPRSTNKRTRKQIQEKEGGEESTAEEKEEPVVEQLQVIDQESGENLEEEDETQQVESEKDLTGAEEAVVQQDAPEEGQANEGKTPEDVTISTAEVAETTAGECTQETMSIVKDDEVKDIPQEEKEPPIIESSGEAKVEEEKEGEAGLGTAKAQEEDKEQTVTLEVEKAGSVDETVTEVEKITGITAAAGDLVEEGEADVALLQPTSDSALPPSNEEEVIHLTVAQQSEETSQTSELQRVTVVLVDLKKSHHETQEETAEEEAEGKTATEEGEEEQREETTADDIPASTTEMENTENLEEEEEKCEEESEEAVTAKDSKAKSAGEDEEETVAETRTLRVRKQAVKATPRRKSSRLRKGEEEKEETPEVEEEEPAAKIRVLRRGRKSIPVTPRSTNKRTRKQIQEKEESEESTADEKEEPVVEQLQVIVPESGENLEEEDETQQVESEKDLTGAEEAVVQQDAPEEGQANEGKTPEDVTLETDPTQETQVEEDQSISTSEVDETTAGECTQETRSIVKDDEVNDVPEEEKEPPIIESSGEAKVEEEKEGEAGLGTAKAQEEDKEQTVTLEVEKAGSEDETVNEVEKMTGMTAAAGDLVEGEADVALLQPTSDSALPPSNEEEVIHLTVAQQSEETSQTSELQRVTVVLVDLKKSHHEAQEETAEEEAEGKTATEEGEEEQREETMADDIPASTTGIENTGNLEEEKCEEESEEAVTATDGKAKSTDEDEEETVAETRTLRVRKQAVKATPRRKSSRLRKGEEEKEETPEVEEEEPAAKVRVLRRGRKSIPVTPRSTNKRTRKQIQEKEESEESPAEEKEEPVEEQLHIIDQESGENLEEEDETQQVESEKDLTSAEEAVVQQDAPEEGQVNEGKTPEDVALETDPTEETPVEEDQSISTTEVAETTAGECTQETMSTVKDDEVAIDSEEKEAPITEPSDSTEVEEEKEIEMEKLAYVSEESVPEQEIVAEAVPETCTEEPEETPVEESAEEPANPEKGDVTDEEEEPVTETQKSATPTPTRKSKRARIQRQPEVSVTEDEDQAEENQISERRSTRKRPRVNYKESEEEGWLAIQKQEEDKEDSDECPADEQIENSSEKGDTLNLVLDIDEQSVLSEEEEVEPVVVGKRVLRGRSIPALIITPQSKPRRSNAKVPTAEESLSDEEEEESPQSNQKRSVRKRKSNVQTSTRKSKRHSRV